MQRNTKIAERLQEKAKHKLEEARRLAMEYKNARDAAVAAARVLCGIAANIQPAVAALYPKQCRIWT